MNRPTVDDLKKKRDGTLQPKMKQDRQNGEPQLKEFIVQAEEDVECVQFVDYYVEAYDEDEAVEKVKRGEYEDVDVVETDMIDGFGRHAMDQRITGVQPYEDT